MYLDGPALFPAAAAAMDDFTRLREQAGDYSSAVNLYQAQLAKTPPHKPFRLHDQSPLITRTWHKIKRFAYELFHSHTTYDEHVLVHIRDQLDHIVLATGATKKRFKDAELEAQEALANTLSVIDELNRKLDREKAEQSENQNKYDISLGRLANATEVADSTTASAQATSDALATLLRNMQSHNEAASTDADTSINPLFEPTTSSATGADSRRQKT